MLEGLCVLQTAELAKTGRGGMSWRDRQAAKNDLTAAGDSALQAAAGPAGPSREVACPFLWWL